MKCITKNDGETADDVEDLDLVMVMYNLLEYSSNYSDTTVSLWFYLKNNGINLNAVIFDGNVFQSFKLRQNYSETQLQMEQMES